MTELDIDRLKLNEYLKVLFSHILVLRFMDGFMQGLRWKEFLK
jgi:hypothetical protein